MSELILPPPVALDALDNLERVGANFLFKYFPYQIHTLFYRASREEMFPSSYTKTYSNRDKKKLEEVAKNCNQQGYDIFFMVNEGDGKTTGSGKTVRNQAAVVALSYCFLDLDGANIDDVLSFLTSVNIKPHLIVQTSDKTATEAAHYHIYIRITDTPKDLAWKWKAVQAALARLGDKDANPKDLGIDEKMVDTCRLLRVPGYYHVEKKFLVRLTEASDHPYYTLDELYNTLNASRFHNLYNKTGPFTDLLEETVYPEGDRWEAIRSASFQYAQISTINYSQKLALLKDFVTRRIDNTDPEFLKDGELTRRSIEALESAITKVKLEEEASIQHKIVPILKKARSPHHLPGDFYLAAPNGFGSVVETILRGSRVPVPTIAFAAALAAASAVRSINWLCPKGRSPALYVINVAPSTSGKSFPYSIMNRTFLRHPEVSRLSFRAIASYEGLGRQLAVSNGVGFFHSDEMETLLTEIQSPKASILYRKIESAFLMLFTDCPERFDWTATLADSKRDKDKVVLNYPALAICGYIVNERFGDIFSEVAVSKGLLGRFLPFITEKIDIPLHLNHDAPPDMVVEHELMIPPINLSGSGLVARVPKRMSFTPEAEQYFKTMTDTLHAKGLEMGDDPDNSKLVPLFNRNGEKIERVATILSLGTIDLNTLKYAETLVVSNTALIMDRMRPKVNGNTKTSALAEKILNKIASRAEKGETTMRSNLHSDLDVKAWELDIALDCLAEAGKIKLTSARNKQNKLVDYYSLGDVL